MRTERQEQKPPIKVGLDCARYADGPNGWFIAHCSLAACQEEEKKGRVWEGPEKSEQCLWDINTINTVDNPVIILQNSSQKDNFWQIVAPHIITDDTWESLVDTLYLPIKDDEVTMDLGHVVLNRIDTVLAPFFRNNEPYVF